ncbi:MAG: tetratricopeptide repeat protein [bacterium]
MRIAEVGDNAVGPLQEARAAYEQALALDPSLPDARRQLAVVLLAQEKPAEALEQPRAAAARPDFRGVLDVELGRAKQALGKTDEAIAHYDAALARNADDALVLLAAGIARFTRGELPQAREPPGKAHAADQAARGPVLPGPRRAEGGGLRAAVQQFKRALEEDKKNTSTTTGWASRSKTRARPRAPGRRVGSKTRHRRGGGGRPAADPGLRGLLPGVAACGPYRLAGSGTGPRPIWRRP